MLKAANLSVNFAFENSLCLCPWGVWQTSKLPRAASLDSISNNFLNSILNKFLNSICNKFLNSISNMFLSVSPWWCLGFRQSSLGLQGRAQPPILIFPLPFPVFVIESQWDAEAPATSVELTCNSSEEKVYWEKDSEWRQEGKSLTAAVKEFPDAGNYSCLSQQSHRLLSSHLLLIAKINSQGRMLRWILKSFKGTALKMLGLSLLSSGKGIPSKALLTGAEKLRFLSSGQSSTGIGIYLGFYCGS